MDLSSNKSTTEPVDVPEGQMFVKVYAPYKDYFDGLALSVSAVNQTGPFDILPGHHRFLTLLSRGDIVIRQADQQQQTIPINNGIMYVLSDRVTVFLDV